MIKLKFIVTVIISICTTGALAQQQYNFKKLDDKQINIAELKDQIKRNRDRMDSIYYAEKMDSIFMLHKYLTTSTTNYTSFTIVTEYSKDDLEKFNNELRANGFKPLNRGSYNLGYGFTIKKKRFLYEYFLILALNNKTTGGGATIKVSGGSLLNLNFGFDILNLPRFQLYPLVGISQQFSNIEYSVKPASDIHFDNLSQVFYNGGTTTLGKNSWNATAGVEFDYHLKYSERGGGIIIGLRYGVTSNIFDGKYKVNKTQINYDPGIKLRESYFSLLFKFYGRTKKTK